MNLIRGDFQVFNSVTSPVSGIDAVGSSWVSGTETVAHFIEAGGKTSRLLYNDTATGVTNQIRVNATTSTLNAAGVGYSNGVTANASQTEMAAANGAVRTTFKNTSTQSFMNEGTTDDGGDGTAVNGYVAKLVDKTTGEWQWGNVTVPAFETVQGVGNPTAIVFVTGVAGEKTIPFVDIVQASTHITLNAGGDIDINTTGKYLFTLDTTWQAAGGAPASRFGINAQVNTVDDLQTVAAFSVSSGGGTAIRDTSQTFILDLASGDNVAFVAKRINGGATISSLAGCRLTANLIG